MISWALVISSGITIILSRKKSKKDWDLIFAYGELSLLWNYGNEWLKAWMWHNHWWRSFQALLVFEQVDFCKPFFAVKESGVIVIISEREHLIYSNQPNKLTDDIIPQVMAYSKSELQKRVRWNKREGGVTT